MNEERRKEEGNGSCNDQRDGNENGSIPGREGSLVAGADRFFQGVAEGPAVKVGLCRGWISSIRLREPLRMRAI